MNKVRFTRRVKLQDLDAWIRMYEEEMTYARQHESLRSNSASLIAAATGAILALFASGTIPLEKQWPTAAALAILVVAINVLGWFVGKKHYERTRRHQAIAQAYRQVISANCQIGGKVLNSVRQKADQRHKSNCRFQFWATTISVHGLWGAIHIVFASLGLFLFAYFICSRLSLS